jgi:hypothetical protein
MIVVLGKQIRLRSRDRQEAGGEQVGSRNQIMKSEKQDAGSKLHETEAES